MQHFFVAPASIDQGTVAFSQSQARQIQSVLRLRPGDRVVVLDNVGWSYDVELTNVSVGAVSGTVISRKLAEGEPRTKLTLYHGLLKGDKNEFILQKCTELGVSTFVPTICDRSVVGSVEGEEKLQRWQRIIAEAAEQSERGRLPSLQPATLFSQGCEQTRGLAFIAWERHADRSLRQALAESVPVKAGNRPFAIHLFIGPEGGFTEAEITYAQRHGIIPVGLGPRILRAETAAIIASTLVLGHVGELG